MTTKERFADAKARMEAAKKEAQEIVKDVFRESAQALFEAHPTLESFGWTQYTPHFNDGEPCVFSANIDEPNFNGEPGYDHDDVHETKSERINGKYETVPNEKYNPESAAAYEAVQEFLGQFDDDDFLAMFDDHNEITVSRNGDVTIEEYEHD